MIEFQVFDGATKPSFGFVASHRIVVPSESGDITYWYVQRDPTVRPFDANEDKDLVELVYAKSRGFKVGEFESFAIGADRNYHVQNIGTHEFVLKSLR